MLIELVNNRRVTDSGFDIPMLDQEVNHNSLLHTFDLNIKVGATNNNRPIPCLLVPRSSLSTSPFRMANSIGLIDMGYRGYVKAKVDVLGRPNNEYIVPYGTRLFQICRGDFMPWDNVVIVQCEHELPAAPDNRGAGGFGSTN
jgi:dUTP pyrophosphatase